MRVFVCVSYNFVFRDGASNRFCNQLLNTVKGIIYNKSRLTSIISNSERELSEYMYRQIRTVRVGRPVTACERSRDAYD